MTSLIMIIIKSILRYMKTTLFRHDWLMTWCWLLSVVQSYAIISSLPLLSDYYMCMMTMSGKNNSIKTFNMRSTYTYSSFEIFLFSIIVFYAIHEQIKLQFVTRFRSWNELIQFTNLGKILVLLRYPGSCS